MRAYPVAVGVTVSAVVVTTVYNYGPTLLDYAFKNKQCYVDGSKDYLAVLQLDNLDAWGIWYQGVEACRTGTRPHQARLEEARLEQERQEMKEQERKEREETAKRTQLATEKHAEQREQGNRRAPRPGRTMKQARTTTTSYWLGQRRFHNYWIW